MFGSHYSAFTNFIICQDMLSLHLKIGQTIHKFEWTVRM